MKELMENRNEFAASVPPFRGAEICLVRPTRDSARCASPRLSHGGLSARKQGTRLCAHGLAALAAVGFEIG